jgi:hypothetical protein
MQRVPQGASPAELPTSFPAALDTAACLKSVRRKNDYYPRRGRVLSPIGANPTPDRLTSLSGQPAAEHPRRVSAPSGKIPGAALTSTLHINYQPLTKGTEEQTYD